MKNSIPSSCAKIFLLLTSILLVGCTQKFSDVSDTLLEAYNTQTDTSLTREELLNIPYASAYLKVDDQKRILVILAFAEINPVTGSEQLKWVSADKAMIVTENGRIVKTIGLPRDNLASIHGAVPTFKSNAGVNEVPFKLTYDWMPNYRYSFPALVTRQFAGEKIITTPLNQIKTQVYTESISFPTLSSSVENTYWVDMSGNVQKSIQHIGPNMERVEFVVLKGFASK
ncbi:YjbF family lipoprotein [Vibrio nereis]|uniref:YjbF family lipoprotein n=1 Tax=Vibrio nereis TaxID=693 RepID=UPI002494419D|nr:YjbF family lipoprotein [Vibrio nereis]